MTEANSTTFVQTGAIELNVGEDAKKAFDLRFSKAGISINGDFYAWTGLKIAAGQLVAEEKLIGTVIAEGEKAGKLAIALDIERLKLVMRRVDAHRESQADGRKSKGERRERPLDPRTKLSSRVAGAIKRLKDLEQVAADKRWEMDFSRFEATLEALRSEVEAALVTEGEGAELEAIGSRIDAYAKSLDDALVSNGIKRAEQWLVRLEEGRDSTGPFSRAIRNSLREIAEKYGADGDAKAARDATHKVFGELAESGKMARAQSYQPESRGRTERRGGSATIGEQLAAKAGQRGGRR